MNSIKKYISILISAVMLMSFAACGAKPAQTEPAAPAPAITQGEVPELITTEEQVPISRTVAYIPLDDRPSNYGCMSYRAQALGYGIVMPDEDLFINRLDGQPANSAGTLCGQREKLFQWLLEQEEKGCDYYIISLDMLLSGGLVNSRSLSSDWNFVFSDDFYDTPAGRAFEESAGQSREDGYREMQILQYLFDYLGSDPDNHVWLLDTVMRLAPTVGYPTDRGHVWTMEEYNSVRSYYAQPRLLPEDPGRAFPPDYYDIGEDGNELDKSAYVKDPGLLTLCNRARSRKFLLSDALLYFVSLDEAGVFNVLFGIDDSANENCVQTGEIGYIRSRLRAQDALLSGVDDMGYKAIARMFLDDIGWEQTAVRIAYFGGAEDEPASPFDYKSLDQTMEEITEFFRISPNPQWSSAEGEFDIFVLTHPDESIKEDADAKAKAVDDLINAVNSSLEKGLPTVLIDASNQGYDNFPQCLAERVPQLGKLLAYSGRLDLANLLGTSLSYASSRYAFLCRGGSTELTDEAHMRVIADVLISDICYRNSLRYSMDSYVKNELGGDYNNFCAPKIDIENAVNYGAANIEQLSSPLIGALQGCSFVRDLDPYTEAPWKPFRLTAFRFPWYRTFECSFGISFQ